MSKPLSWTMRGHNEKRASNDPIPEWAITATENLESKLSALEAQIAEVRGSAIGECIVIADGIANGTNEWSEARRIAREIRELLSPAPGAEKSPSPSARSGEEA